MVAKNKDSILIIIDIFNALFFPLWLITMI
jgi:hypothetical protein